MDIQEGLLFIIVGQPAMTQKRGLFGIKTTSIKCSKSTKGSAMSTQIKELLPLLNIAILFIIPYLTRIEHRLTQIETTIKERKKI